MNGPMLIPCDIFFTRGAGKLSKMIRYCTRSKGESPTIANHVGLIAYPGCGRQARAIEALWTVKFHRLSEQYGADDELCVFRPRNLATAELDAIYAKACEFINRKYGYGKIALHALDYLIGGRYFFRRVGRVDNYPICSYLVAEAYGSAGLHFGVADNAASPDDIWDFVVKNPDKYRFVWQQGTMYQEGR